MGDQINQPINERVTLQTPKRITPSTINKIHVKKKKETDNQCVSRSIEYNSNLEIESPGQIIQNE